MSCKMRPDQVQFINHELEGLPAAEKTVIQLKFWHNYTLEEIAFICDLPLTLIQKLFDMAIHRLRLNYLVEFSTTKNVRESI